MNNNNKTISFPDLIFMETVDYKAYSYLQQYNNDDDNGYLFSNIKTNKINEKELNQVFTSIKLCIENIFEKGGIA